MIDSKQNFINKKYHSSAGRITRKTFFFTQLLIIALSFVVSFVFSMGITIAEIKHFSGFATFLTVICFLISIYIYVLSVFSLIKRCRDAGISAYWCFLLLVPIVNFVFYIFLFFKGSIPLPQASAAQNLENKN